MSQISSRRFRITMRNIDNPEKHRSKTIEAVDEDSAYSLADTERGWEISGVSDMGPSKAAGSGFSFFRRNTNKFPTKDLIRFCRGMSTMLNAGISTVDSLNFYSNNLPQKHLQLVLRKISYEIEMGEQPDVAFAKTGLFSNVFIGLIKAGVSSGDLGGALNSIAHQMYILTSFRSRLKRIMTVPLAVLVFLALIFIAAQCIITPRIEQMLVANRAVPDAFSAAVFTMSHFVQKAWPFAIGGFLFVLGFFIWRKGARDIVVNFLMSKWRLLRTVIMSMRQLTFVGTLNMMICNKIPMEEALRICVLVLKGTAMSQEVEEARTQYLSGINVSDCVKRYTSCEPTVVHMLAIGEKTASLPAQLTLCTKMLEEQAEEAMTDFATVTSTISTIVPVFVIGFTFVASYLPIILMSARMMQAFTGK